MKTITQELQQDFERLHETSMEWNQATWYAQILDGRFVSDNGTLDFDHRYIYWYENYASLLAARSILYIMGEKYTVISDEATGQWCMTSTYASAAWQR